MVVGAGRLLYDVVCWLTSTDTLDTVHVAGAGRCKGSLSNLTFVSDDWSTQAP